MSLDLARGEFISPGPSSDAFLRRIRSAPRLSAGRERLLAAATRQGDPRAKRQLVAANLPLVVSIAQRYRGRGLELEDLVQEGTLGLIRAIEKFDLVRDVRLATYATWWIRDSIGRALLAGSRPMRLPGSAAGKLRALERARFELRAELRREPSSDDLAHATGISVAALAGLQACEAPVRLDATTEDGVAVSELIADCPESDVSRRSTDELLSLLRRALDQLQDPRQRYILKHHYGLDHCGTQTVRQIGAALGLSGARVSQLKSAALTELASLPAARECREALAASSTV